MNKDTFAGGRKPTFIAAASLRKNQTKVEQVLWEYVGKKTFGASFAANTFMPPGRPPSIAMLSNLSLKLTVQSMTKKKRRKPTSAVKKKGKCVA